MSRARVVRLAGSVALAVALVAGCGPFGGGRGPNESRVDGVPSMSLAVSGQGAALSLAWEPVTGASEYDVVVLDSKGQGAWSWSGSSTSVTPPAYAPIPGHGSASVAAFDAKHHPLGLSDSVKF